MTAIYIFKMNNIKSIRSDLGMNQQELALKTYLTQAFISKIESGERGVSLVTARKIAKALECDVDDLFPELSK